VDDATDATHVDTIVEEIALDDFKIRWNWLIRRNANALFGALPRTPAPRRPRERTNGDAVRQRTMCDPGTQRAGHARDERNAIGFQCPGVPIPIVHYYTSLTTTDSAT
jgi:hypothetical protein